MTPVLVLPTSLGTTTQLWDGNVGHWSAFGLVPYRQRGRTSIEELGRDLLELLDERGIDRASICGVSLGGATAMWVAANEPDRVDRVVLACTSARFGEPEQWRERAAAVRSEGLEHLADSIVTRWFTPAAPADLVARFRAQLLGTPPEDYARLCDALAGWDFRERLGEVRASTLVIGGAEDPATPLEHQRLLAERIPRAKLIVLDGAAHLANAERPEPFSRLVADHVTSAAVEAA